MDQHEFKKLFERVLEDVISNAEVRLERALSRHINIELHGAGHPGDFVSVEEALQSLYLDEDRLWAIVDVAVKEISPVSTTMFVRASGHTPTTFDKTWNDPPGNGPFKEIVAWRVKILSDDQT